MKPPVRLAMVAAVLLAAVVSAFWLAGRAAAPPPGPDPALSRPLLAAVGAGDASEVKNLLERGAPPNARRSDPLFVPWHEKVLDAVLLRRRPPPPGNGGLDTTALVTAIQDGRGDIALLLLEHGADPDVKNLGKGGLTALILAAMLGKTAMAETLLDRGANPNGRSPRDETPLMYARDARIARLLIARGAYVDARDSDGTTPLIYAARHGKPEIIRLLLKHGADVHARNRQGRTALRVATHARSVRGPLNPPEKRVEMAKVLKAAGATE